MPRDDNDWLKEGRKQDLEDKITKWWTEALDRPMNKHEEFFAKWGASILLACVLIFICALLIAMTVWTIKGIV
jgi:hypothetical protein